MPNPNQNKNNFTIDTQNYEYKSNTTTQKTDPEQMKNPFPGQFMGYPPFFGGDMYLLLLIF